jgi:dUTP pyrophosphatase
MQIRPRSGLALKNQITITNSPGTLDPDFRGPIKVILFNLGKEPFYVKNGDRVAQAVICPVFKPEIIEVNELEKTERGEKGFGSTGK